MLSFNPINAETLPICDLSAMQYGRCLDRLLCEIVYANPKLGPVHMIKADVSDGCYRIGLCLSSAAKLGLVFPSEAGDEDLVAILSTLLMVWKNWPPIFCTPTETVADLANEALRAHAPTLPHKLDERAEAVRIEPAPSLDKQLVALPRKPYIGRKNSQLLQYVDVFVDDFLGLAQGPRHGCLHVRRTLFHALDKVFCPIDSKDIWERKEVLSPQKLDAGDCSWST